MTNNYMNDPSLSGFTLRHLLLGHKKGTNQLIWSPDGRTLASASIDRTIRLWNIDSGEMRSLFEVNGPIYSIEWSPDGIFLAAGGVLGINIWNTMTEKLHLELKTRPISVQSMRWSPDGEIIAAGTDDKTLQLWNVKTRHHIRKLTGHSKVIRSLAWSPDGQVLASGSSDSTIRLWDPKGRGEMSILEGHTGPITSVSFLFNNNITDELSSYYALASKSLDGTIRFWPYYYHEMLETVAIIKKPSSDILNNSLTLNPKLPLLATFGEDDVKIRVWDLNLTTILSVAPDTHSVHYTNAKVVLVGDRGVGKSGLGLVLADQKFEPTASTHNRQVWVFDTEKVKLENGREETREILLWDLAGQPGYRLIHQLHLNEVAIALVVTDAQSETDPFAGVYHWDRALRSALSVPGNPSPPLKKFLVAARIDRGGIGVSRARIESLMEELGFDKYFETSAQEGWGIEELKLAILETINWEMFPKISSTDFFSHIKNFLTSEKENGRLLSTVDDLYRAFQHVYWAMQYSESTSIDSKGLHAQFEACIGRVESRGLIRRLKFGNLVLLQPELLDAYASALVNAVKDEPDGLGNISEEKARSGDFSLPKSERIKNREQEKLLLIAMIEDLLRHEIALREYADDGPYLVFPSQSTRENLDLPDPEGKAVIFDFEGPVLNIYATLAVRLSHSGLFTRKEIWKNAVIYTALPGGLCGISLRSNSEGRGELTLFFDKKTTQETRFQFETYIQTHLLRWALPESIKRTGIITCPECGEPFTPSQVLHRLERNLKKIRCSVCETEVSLLGWEERLIRAQEVIIQNMDKAADNRREREATASVLQGKIETSDFDVFLCYNNEDKAEVKAIGEQLKERGILPWLDDWELRPGLPWQRLLEQQIGRIKTAAVFVGKKGIGPWQQEELEAFLREFIRRGSPVIPVLLADGPKEARLPIFLQGMSWVDFRKRNRNSRKQEDPVERLIWGITGERGPVQ